MTTNRLHRAAIHRRLMIFLESEDAKLCNCSMCGVDLLSVESRSRISVKEIPPGIGIPGAVGGRIRGRPVCHKCLILGEKA